MKKSVVKGKTEIFVFSLLLILFVGVCVLTVILFGMLEGAQKDLYDYRSDAEIKLSELEKEKNEVGKNAGELRSALALAEKNSAELELKIGQIKEEMKNLQDGLNNTDSIYSSLNSKLSKAEEELAEKKAEIEALKKDIEALSSVSTIDMNAQTKLFAELEKLLSQGAPMNKVDRYGVNDDGTPSVNTSYVYPKISLYYEDLVGGYKYTWNADSVFSSESGAKLPFALSVLISASDEQNSYNKYVADYIAKYGADAKIPAYKFKYDLSKVYTYEESDYSTGSGIIKEEEFGVQYTHAELFKHLLQYSDSIAYDVLRDSYGTKLLKNYAKNVGTSAMKGNIYTGSANDFGKIMKELYLFTEGNAYYAGLVKESLTSSIHTVMIGKGVSPKKICHKYTWEDGAYYDMAIVYDSSPYILVFMSDMDEGGDTVNKYVQSVAAVIDEIHENFHK